MADQASVRIAGRQVAADALNRIEIAGRAEQMYRESYLAPLLEAGYRPAQFDSGLVEMMRNETRVSQIASHVASTSTEVDATATHPPTSERIARIAGLSDPAEIAVDTRPASALWDDPQRWSNVAYEAWLQRLMTFPQRLRIVGWDAFAEVTADRRYRANAALVDDVLAKLDLAPGLDGVRAAMDGGLAGALVSGLPRWRIEGVDSRQSVLISAIIAVSIRRVVDQGVGHFRFSWAAPLDLVDQHDQPVPIGALARSAVAGDWVPLETAVQWEPTRRSSPSSSDDAPRQTEPDPSATNRSTTL